MWMALRPQRSQAFECSKGKEFPLEVKQLASRLRIAGHRECVLAFPPQKINRGNASTETILGIPSLFAIVKMSNHRFYDHHPWKRWSVSCCSYRYVLGISPESMWPLNRSRFELKGLPLLRHSLDSIIVHEFLNGLTWWAGRIASLRFMELERAFRNFLFQLIFYSGRSG